MTGLYLFLYRCMPALLKLFFRVRYTGVSPTPEGPYIVCSNHLSAMDMFFLALGIDRQIHFFAKAEAFSIPLIGKAVKALGAIPVHRGDTDIHAIKTAIRTLQEGKIVGIFPQGTRIPDKKPSADDAKSGIALIAHRAKAGIIPAYIDTKRFRIRLFRPVTVCFGEPIPYEKLGFVNGTLEEYNAVTAHIFNTVCSLAPDTGKESRPW